MKVFISQPMRGLSDEDIKANREKAISFIKDKFGEDAEVISSFFEGESTPDNPLELLGHSISLLNEANYIYMCAGWEKARGCIIEHECAMRYGINIIYEDADHTQKAYTDILSINDTIPYMMSESFKDRIFAEYWQTKTRYNNLHKLLVKIDANTAAYAGKCTKELLAEQASIMGRYLYLLEMRAEIEGIDLGI